MTRICDSFSSKAVYGLFRASGIRSVVYDGSERLRSLILSPISWGFSLSGLSHVASGATTQATAARSPVNRAVAWKMPCSLTRRKRAGLIPPAVERAVKRPRVDGNITLFG